LIRLAVGVDPTDALDKLDKDATEGLGVMGTDSVDCGVVVTVEFSPTDELEREFMECKRLTGVCTSTTSFLF
jgi:hypothetical protein